jgi:hypothetical protein
VHILLLLALQVTPARGDVVMQAARKAVTTLGDTAAVRAAGYNPITEDRIPDGLPFQGWHWRRAQPGDTVPDVGIDRPSFVMFAPVNGVPKRVGVAYSSALLLDAPAPSGLAGDPAAKWHDHFWCDSVPNVNGGFLVNAREGCTDRGGKLAPRRTAMVHVWTDVPNPEGQYGNDNPALPFVAVGLAPPSEHDVHDAARVRATRALGMALAETYNSRMPVSNRVQRDNRDPVLADSVEKRRAAIAALVPALKRAQTANDRATYEQIATKTVAEWEALIGLYQRMAATPQLKAQVQRAHERVLTVSAHH